MIIKTNPINKENLINLINKIKIIENIEIEPDAQEFIINISNNTIKILINYMEKFKLFNEKITLNIAIQLCSNISFFSFEEYTRLLKNKDLNEAIKTIYKIYDKGKYFRYDLPLTVDGWILSNIMYPTILTIVLDTFLREGQAPNFRDTFLSEYIVTSMGETETGTG